MSENGREFGVILTIRAVHIPWDTAEYHRKRKQDEKLCRIKFPDPKLGAFSEPLTVVDLDGRIILWYLPGLLSVEQQVSSSNVL